MLDINAITEVIRGWIEAETALQCIYDDGDGPRPKDPYLTLKAVTTTPYGQGEYYTEQLPNFIAQFNRSIISDMMVSVNAFRGSPFSTISVLQDSLDKIDTLDIFTAAGIGIGRTSDIRDIPAVVGQKWEDRAQIDLFFNVRSYSVDTVEEIKQVEITNEIDGETTIIQSPDLP